MLALSILFPQDCNALKFELICDACALCPLLIPLLALYGTLHVVAPAGRDETTIAPTIGGTTIAMRKATRSAALQALKRIP